MSTKLHRLVAPALASTCLLLGGCLVVTGSSVDEFGVPVSNATLSQIEPGSTTEAWLIATLGEPTERREVDGQPGTSVLRYTYRRTESSGGAVFLLFAGGSSSKTSWTTFFEVVDGTVTRYWTEPPQQVPGSSDDRGD